MFELDGAQTYYEFDSLRLELEPKASVSDFTSTRAWNPKHPSDANWPVLADLNGVQENRFPSIVCWLANLLQTYLAIRDD